MTAKEDTISIRACHGRHETSAITIIAKITTTTRCTGHHDHGRDDSRGWVAAAKHIGQTMKRQIAISALLWLMLKSVALAVPSSFSPEIDSLNITALDTQDISIEQLRCRVDSLAIVSAHRDQFVLSVQDRLRSSSVSIVASQWVSAIASMLAVFAALWIAVFAERFKAKRNAPKIDAAIDPGPPDCLKIPMSVARENGRHDEMSSYWYRIRVSNSGKSHAKNVTLFLSRIEAKSNDGIWIEDNRFIPLHLVWANTQMFRQDERARTVKSIIPKSSFAHCDLGFAVSPTYNGIHEREGNPHVQFKLETFITPNTKSNVLDKGMYRVSVEISAENADTKTLQLLVDNTGVWTEVEVTMLTTNLRVFLA